MRAVLISRLIRARTMGYPAAGCDQPPLLRRPASKPFLNARRCRWNLKRFARYLSLVSNPSRASSSSICLARTSSTSSSSRTFAVAPTSFPSWNAFANSKSSRSASKTSRQIAWGPAWVRSVTPSTVLASPLQVDKPIMWTTLVRQAPAAIGGIDVPHIPSRIHSGRNSPGRGLGVRHCSPPPSAESRAGIKVGRSSLTVVHTMSRSTSKYA